MAAERRLIAAADNGAPAGELAARPEDGGKVRFRYYDSYASDPTCVPLSSSMPVSGAGWHDATAWVDGLLPDNDKVRQRWKAAYGAASTGPFHLLSTRVGRDCAGAFRFCPEEELDEFLARPSGVEDLAIAQVEELIEHLEQERTDWHADQGARSAFSLAGAQTKKALRYDNGRWGLPYGAEASTHILKPAVPGFAHQDAVEHISQSMARAVGMQAADTRLIETGGKTALLVTRYDRHRLADGGIRRVHQEDMCQALGVPPAKKYESDGGPSAGHVAALLRAASCEPEDDVRRFRDALIFNWIIAGTDAHAKNYGLVLRPGANIRLAPLYDVCSLLPYAKVSIWGLQSAMSIGGACKLRKVDRPLPWERLSSDLGVSPGETRQAIRAMVPQVVGAYESALEDIPARLSGRATFKSMQRRLERRAIDCEAAGRPAPKTAQAASRRDGGDAGETAQAAPALKLGRCGRVGPKSRKPCILRKDHSGQHRY